MRNCVELKRLALLLHELGRGHAECTSGPSLSPLPRFATRGPMGTVGAPGTTPRVYSSGATTSPKAGALLRGCTASAIATCRRPTASLRDTRAGRIVMLARQYRARHRKNAKAIVTGGDHLNVHRVWFPGGNNKVPLNTAKSAFQNCVAEKTLLVRGECIKRGSKGLPSKDFWRNRIAGAAARIRDEHTLSRLSPI